MKYKFQQMMPRVLMILLILVLVSAVLVSSVFAKYVATGEFDTPPEVTPAAFEFDLHGDRIDALGINFANDGAPGAPIGHSEDKDHYIFSVKSCASEVAIEFETTVTFSREIHSKIMQARADKYAKGIWLEYKIYEAVKNENGKVTSWKEITNDNAEEIKNPDNTLTWKRTIISNPKEHPDSTITGKAYYRVEIISYNNTLMDETSAQEYFFSTNAIEINVTGTQVKPA